MLIFWKAQLALLAVPKTGTTALEQCLAPDADAAILNPPGLKHCTVKKFRRELSGFFEQKGKRPLELVAVMREPVDWLGSWFRYRSRADLNGNPNSTAGMTFEQFVEAYLEDQPPAFAKVGAQANFLDGGVDHLFRHDDMPRLVGFLEERLDRRIILDRANVSPQGDLSLSQRTRARLQENRSDDFTLWASLSKAGSG